MVRRQAGDAALRGQLTADAGVARTPGTGVGRGWNDPCRARSSPAEARKALEETAQTVSDVERSISDQVELVAVMNEIAEVSCRTFAPEEQREAENTRGLFLGFLLSVAVMAAGWSPIVMASWHQRLWIGILTTATCTFAGGVCVLIRRRQVASAPGDDTRAIKDNWEWVTRGPLNAYPHSPADEPVLHRSWGDPAA